MVIGGHEDKSRDAEILGSFYELAGGRDARIVVCPLASVEPRRAARPYVELFEDLGAREVRVLEASSRDEIIDLPRDYLDDTTAFFFTGGDQLRITSLLGGSSLEKQLHDAFRDGLLIGGTSAGAAAVSDTMIIGGEGERAPTFNTVQMAPGLAFLEEVLVDQHFNQRGRTGRLLAALALNPHTLGAGIDENTAIHVRPGGECTVLGEGAVTFFDGQSAHFTNVSGQGVGKPLALAGVTVHVLPAGYGFDLVSRVPFSVDDRGAQRALSARQARD